MLTRLRKNNWRWSWSCRSAEHVNRRIQNPKSDKNTLEVNFSKDGEVYQRFRLEIPTVDKCLRSLKRKMLRLSLSTLLRRLAELVRVEYWTYDYEKEEEADGRGWSVRATRSSHESNEDRSYRVVAFRKPVELYLYMERLWGNNKTMLQYSYDIDWRIINRRSTSVPFTIFRNDMLFRVVGRSSVQWVRVEGIQ